MLDTKRRELIALLGAGGLLLAVKVGRALGQQPPMPVIGVLSGTALSEVYLSAFRQGRPNCAIYDAWRPLWPPMILLGFSGLAEGNYAITNHFLHSVGAAYCGLTALNAARSGQKRRVSRAAQRARKARESLPKC
jgi:uncharacterized membrane protein YfcA